MKKETTITAIVFLVVGFFIGYITEAEFNWNAPEKMAPVSAAATSAEASGGASQTATGAAQGDAKLPPGHPPLEDAAKIQALQNQAAQNPADPNPPLELANYYFDHHLYDRAAEWYQKALHLDPKNVNARTDLGTAYFNLGRPTDALKEYQKSLESDPTHEPTMYNTIIVNLEGTHDHRAARAAWDRLHKRNPNYPGLDGLKERLESASRATSDAVPAR